MGQSASRPSDFARKTERRRLLDFPARRRPARAPCAVGLPRRIRAQPGIRDRLRRRCSAGADPRREVGGAFQTRLEPDAAGLQPLRRARRHAARRSRATLSRRRNRRAAATGRRRAGGSFAGNGRPYRARAGRDRRRRRHAAAPEQNGAGARAGAQGYDRHSLARQRRASDALPRFDFFPHAQRRLRRARRRQWNGRAGRARRARAHEARGAAPDGRAQPDAVQLFGALQLRRARARGDTIVFLNNDTVVLQPHWLARMLEFAAESDVGAVGCKLLFPTGRVQHAGVVLGMGGVAGHFDAGIGRRAHGWLGGSLGPHETSAVTAACLMVERSKFEAVGGFDADNLPVDLNDIDLCLRLNARGWRTICDCRTMLAHRQSASRGGGALRLQRVYRKEREIFLARWGAAIRNDPFFNPNLSLYDHEPKLG
ncbi:MAG: glycosyltransferase family 2 protein [Methylobacteriaceae bacterium]|nr:glycosyltransferase family 2 protein [Methylobacteriaceae bacterium]